MAAILFAVLAGLFWGVGELCAKSALKSGDIGPMTAIAVRTAVALPVLLLAFLAASRGWLERAGVAAAREPAGWIHAPTPVLLKVVLGAGLCAGALGLMFFYLGLSAGEISKVKPIAFALAPAIAVFGGWLLLGEPLSLQKVLALALIVAGVVLLTTAR
jgi:uncharacterized membrane protein